MGEQELQLQDIVTTETPPNSKGMIDGIKSYTKVTSAERKRMAKDYNKGCLSVSEIAVKYERSTSTVRRNLKKEDVRLVNGLSDIEVFRIIREWIHTEGNSTEISRITGNSRDAVTKYLNMYNLPVLEHELSLDEQLEIVQAYGRSRKKRLEDLAKKFGRSTSTIAKYVRLNDCEIKRGRKPVTIPKKAKEQAIAIYDKVNGNLSEAERRLKHLNIGGYLIAKCWDEESLDHGIALYITNLCNTLLAYSTSLANSRKASVSVPCSPQNIGRIWRLNELRTVHSKTSEENRPKYMTSEEEVDLLVTIINAFRYYGGDEQDASSNLQLPSEYILDIWKRNKLSSTSNLHSEYEYYRILAKADMAIARAKELQGPVIPKILNQKRYMNAI